MLLLVLLSIVLLAAASACGGTVPPSSRVGGGLLPCDDKPHCVSTDSSEPAARRMAPIPFSDSPEAAQRRVRAALRAEPRAVILQDEPGYVRAAMASRVFRFVDDVELLIDSTTHRILFRSSARLGRNDFGVNRARMERIQARLLRP